MKEKREKGRQGGEGRRKRGRKEGTGEGKEWSSDKRCGWMWVFHTYVSGHTKRETALRLCQGHGQHLLCVSDATYAPKRHAYACSQDYYTKILKKKCQDYKQPMPTTNKMDKSQAIPIIVSKISNDTEQTASPHNANPSCNTSLTHTKYSRQAPKPGRGQEPLDTFTLGKEMGLQTSKESPLDGCH